MTVFDILRAGRRARVYGPFRRVFGAAVFASVLFALVHAGCVSHREPKPPPLTDDQVALNVASFDQVWQTVKDRHWDPKLNGADWDGARAELRPKVESARSMKAARAAMDELIKRLKQSHFAIV